jgi:ribosomal protein L40E
MYRSDIMAKKVFPEAVARLYTRVFVCRVCKRKIRADPIKVKEGKVKCRKCGSHSLRPKKRPL